MLTLQSLIHVPINSLHCLKAVWCQVWWVFGFSQQMGLTVSPLLYLMWPLYGATSVGARAREAVSPTLWHHVSSERPAARALIHIYSLLRPALEAPENNLSVVEAPPPPPAEWTSTNSHLFNSFNLLPLLSWLVGHPFSDLRHKPSSQPELLLTSCWLQLSVTKRCLFFLQSVLGMGPLLSLLRGLPDESAWHLTGALEEASSRGLMPLACLVSSPFSTPLYESSSRPESN